MNQTFDEIEQSFVESLTTINVTINESQLAQFRTYFQVLIEWNEQMNLTAITAPKEVYIKHFLDSLTVSHFINLKEINNLADIGSGAGFPSIPLKIMFPHLNVTLIDSLQKRIKFLQTLIHAVGLTNVHFYHGRAEELARETTHRDRYELVVARAVARLPVLNELCLPFVAPGGMFVAMKGSNYLDELQESNKSLKLLHASVAGTHEFLLPLEPANRAIITILKTAPTPKLYPRRPGMPTRHPL